MPFEPCPSCTFPEAERSEVFDATTEAPMGTQLFCPRCRFYSPPKAVPASEPGIHAKLKKMGFTDEEMAVLFPQLQGNQRVAIPGKTS